MKKEINSEQETIMFYYFRCNKKNTQESHLMTLNRQGP